MKYVILAISFLVIESVHAQTFITNKKDLDTDRYKGISGSPYLFDDSVDAILLMRDSDEGHTVSLNINLHESEVEVYKSNQYAEIEKSDIKEISLSSEGIEYLITYANGTFVYRIFAGDRYCLFLQPKVIMETIIHRPPGEIIEKERFKRKDQYIINIADESMTVELNKKSVAKALGKEAEAKMKSTKNKIKSLGDFIRLLEALEE